LVLVVTMPMFCFATVALLAVLCRSAESWNEQDASNALRRRKTSDRSLQTDSGITSLELIYTGASPHVSVMNLTLDAVNVIDLAALGLAADKFNINAVRTGTDVSSVQFSNGHYEGFVPYAYCANVGPVYNTCSDLVVGTLLTVSVVPYPLPNLQGTPFPTVTTTLKIVHSALVAPSLPPTPPPIAPILAKLVDSPTLAPSMAPIPSPPPTAPPVTQFDDSPTLAPTPAPIPSLPVASPKKCSIPKVRCRQFRRPWPAKVAHTFLVACAHHASWWERLGKKERRIRSSWPKLKAP
jgi:hypothetical protein